MSGSSSTAMADAARQVQLASGSRAEDAGYGTVADLSRLCSDLQIEYRLVGGLAVALIHAAHGSPGEVPARQTADADLGADENVVAESRLGTELQRQGYQQKEGNLDLWKLLETALSLGITAADWPPVHAQKRDALRHLQERVIPAASVAANIARGKGWPHQRIAALARQHVAALG